MDVSLSLKAKQRVALGYLQRSLGKKKKNQNLDLHSENIHFTQVFVCEFSSLDADFH